VGSFFASLLDFTWGTCLKIRTSKLDIKPLADPF
jgi:hypothetical protein